jgi:hypothetical protein
MHIVQVNVCSLPNKKHYVFNLVNINHIHILAWTETHLDASVNDGQINIQGYSLCHVLTYISLKVRTLERELEFLLVGR